MSSFHPTAVGGLCYCSLLEATLDSLGVPLPLLVNPNNFVKHQSWIFHSYFHFATSYQPACFKGPTLSLNLKLIGKALTTFRSSVLGPKWFN